MHEMPGSRLEQDPDVLDTWFSSGLLPFTALGWPEHARSRSFLSHLAADYGIRHPVFLVARMIMLAAGSWRRRINQGNHKTTIRARKTFCVRVCLSGKSISCSVRDADDKNVEDKGNVLIRLRSSSSTETTLLAFTLAAMAAPGTDIAFYASRTAGYRNFANKIWNASRFMF